MTKREPRRDPGDDRYATGIASAAVVLAGAAVLNCVLGLAGVRAAESVGPLTGPAFFLLGLELAGMAVTVALVALALGPRWRGPGEPRRAWWAGGVGLAVIAGGVVFVVPRLALLSNG